MRTRYAALSVALILLAVAEASTAAKTSPLVGRWQTVRTCEGLVVALQKAGLGAVAPGVVGDYFPNKTPQELARKQNLCQRAKPQIHGHFFTRDGKFGSLDQNAQQVDDGTYQLTGSTVTIGKGSFHVCAAASSVCAAPRERHLCLPSRRSSSHLFFASALFEPIPVGNK